MDIGGYGDNSGDSGGIGGIDCDGGGGSDGGDGIWTKKRLSEENSDTGTNQVQTLPFSRMPAGVRGNKINFSLNFHKLITTSLLL